MTGVVGLHCHCSAASPPGQSCHQQNDKILMWCRRRLVCTGCHSSYALRIRIARTMEITIETGTRDYTVEGKEQKKKNNYWVIQSHWHSAWTMHWHNVHRRGLNCNSCSKSLNEYTHTYALHGRGWWRKAMPSQIDNVPIHAHAHKMDKWNR